MDTQKTPGKTRGLGRGLDALFGDEETPLGESGGEKGGQRRTIGIDRLEPGRFQPRQQFDESSLKQLADSIAVHGLLQPILVRPIKGEEEKYEIIAGERRWRAAQKAQLHDVPVMIRDLADTEALEIALVENLQREDLNILDEAAGYRRLMEEFGHTQEKLAASLGKSRSHVANTLRLLNLPDKVQFYVREGKLSAGHARAVLGAANPEALATEIVAHGLSVREAEKRAAQESDAPRKNGSATKSRPQKDLDTLALEAEISSVLGMKVEIDVKANSKAGTLKVSFGNLDQLDEILHRLSHNPGKMAISG